MRQSRRGGISAQRRRPRPDGVPFDAGRHRDQLSHASRRLHRLTIVARIPEAHRVGRCAQHRLAVRRRPRLEAPLARPVSAASPPALESQRGGKTSAPMASTAKSAAPSASAHPGGAPPVWANGGWKGGGRNRYVDPTAAADAEARTHQRDRRWLLNALRLLGRDGRASPRRCRGVRRADGRRKRDRARPRR